MNDDESLSYQTGFGNHFATEAETGALPKGRNSPQRVEHGLYAELLSGTSTANLSDEEREILFRVVGGKDPMGHDTGTELTRILEPELRSRKLELRRDKVGSRTQMGHGG